MALNDVYWQPYFNLMQATLINDPRFVDHFEKFILCGDYEDDIPVVIERGKEYVASLSEKSRETLFGNVEYIIDKKQLHLASVKAIDFAYERLKKSLMGELLKYGALYGHIKVARNFLGDDDLGQLIGMIDTLPNSLKIDVGLLSYMVQKRKDVENALMTENYLFNLSRESQPDQPAILV